MDLGLSMCPGMCPFGLGRATFVSRQVWECPYVSPWFARPGTKEEGHTAKKAFSGFLFAPWALILAQSASTTTEGPVWGVLDPFALELMCPRATGQGHVCPPCRDTCVPGTHWCDFRFTCFYPIFQAASCIEIPLKWLTCINCRPCLVPEERFIELLVSNTVCKVSKFFRRESQRTWRMDSINVMWLMKLSASFLGLRFCISPDMVWRVSWQHDHSTYEGQWSRKWKDVMRWLAAAAAKDTGFLILFCISWPSHDYFLKVDGLRKWKDMMKW